MKAEIDDPILAGFLERLEEINSFADAGPGSVSQLQTTEGKATSLRPFEDDRTVLNMPVCATGETLRHFVYQPRRKVSADD